jgi:hypothetical protein
VSIISRSITKDEFQGDKDKEALRLLDLLFSTIPQYEPFQIHEIVRESVLSDVDKKNALLLSSHINNILTSDGYAEIPAGLNLMLKLTRLGREVKEMGGINAYKNQRRGIQSSPGHSKVFVPSILYDENFFTLDVFISHSSADADIAKGVIELIHAAMDIPTNKIRCTSVEGYKFMAGTDINAALREEIFSSKVFIAILTEKSVVSTYVLFELGARWGLQLRIFPLVLNSAGANLINGPLTSLVTLNCKVEEDLKQLVNDLSKELNINLKQSSVYKDKLNALLKLAQKKDESFVNTTEKPFEKVEKEAHFKGGEVAWRKYLERNLDANTPVRNGAPVGSYTVWIQFVVDNNGEIIETNALTNHGYGMEGEAIKVIKRGPVWEPAIQNGRPVKAYRKQPITFVVNEE